MLRLFRFDYSCYALKAQMALDLCGLQYELVDVPHSDRNELATVTGGYIMVPVLDRGAGDVLLGSDVICKTLDAEHPGKLIPDPSMAAAVWVFHDWCDNELEDKLFRCAVPGLEQRFERPGDRAMFRFIKERRFGTGCVDDWARNHASLVNALRRTLEPTLATLEHQPFVFGDRPTLADAALYGPCRMLEIGNAAALSAVSEQLAPWLRSVESAVAALRSAE